MLPLALLTALLAALLAALLLLLSDIWSGAQSCNAALITVPTR